MLQSCMNWKQEVWLFVLAGLQSPRAQFLHCCVVDDDKGGASALLACLTHVTLCSQLGQDPWRVEIVDTSLQEAGSQGQAQHLLWLQLQPVLALAHPCEGAVHLYTLQADNNKVTHTLQHILVEDSNSKIQKTNVKRDTWCFGASGQW